MPAPTHTKLTRGVSSRPMLKFAWFSVNVPTLSRFGLPATEAMRGLITPWRRPPTTFAKAAPMTTATARSTTLPRIKKSLKPLSMGLLSGHTITFGPEPANVFVPSGDPTHFSGQPLNSGILLPGSSFKVTFTKAGTYHYICGLHDYLGMVGTVRVTND